MCCCLKISLLSCILSIIFNFCSLFIFFFFFSSRRRHTRYWRDWSSDVCSSDLLAALVDVGHAGRRQLEQGLAQRVDPARLDQRRHERLQRGREGLVGQQPLDERSEERRVGKECRSRRSPYH